MADVDLYGERDETACPPLATSEAQFLQIWDPEIKRAAKARARGRINPGYEADELAQRARIKLMHLYRAGKSQAVGYVRTAIANAMSAPVPQDRALAQAQEITVELPAAPEAEHDHYASAVVTRWVRTLPSQFQSTYRLLYVQDMTQREVAVRMRRTQPRVAQLHRSLILMAANDLRRLAA
ncbi:hypothetical protein [Lysobacter sp. 22409]|uniref:hypothetical protein n=1 Tax=Lysobacter sp. 22409 TaxID=3453917 RepID=UPI003F835315